MSLASAKQVLENSLQHAKNCSCGLVAQERVFAIERGPSGGQELLVTVFLDDPMFGFWYGHVLPHPAKERVHVALLVRSDKFINAPSVPLLFRRFWYWVKDRLEYHPCTIQQHDDAFAEAGSVELAAIALSRMISVFEIDRRTGFDGSDYQNDPCELRIFGIYGIADSLSASGTFPPIPVVTPLKLVGNPD